MLSFRTIVTIDKSFRDLIKSGTYEKYVFTIISRSEKLFARRRFIYNVAQSHGECDFVDDQGQKYDTKLVFNKKQGQLIGDPKNQIQDWLQAMMDEKVEFAESIQKRDLSLVVSTELYRIMKDRLESVAADENAILFIPYPIVDDYKESVFLQFATDFLQAVYDRLVEDGVVGNRKVYFIYPSMDSHVYVLRSASRAREYIRCDELDDFIRYETGYAVE